MRGLIDHTYKQVRRAVVAVIGGTVVLAGVVMLVTPGPAFIVIPVGLAILASEFVWARRILHQVRERLSRTLGKKPGQPEEKG